jgi:DNA repair exonuclease SbcCD nuclease subunit
MTVIVTSDLHLTDNPRDSDRWNIFPWLQKQVKKTGAKTVAILGDLTDAKDRHPSALVNRFVNELDALSTIAGVIVLRGNHDYIDIERPFFGFIDHQPNITFVDGPYEIELDDGTAERGRTAKTSLFLPNTKDHENDWKDLSLKGVDYIFCHQTFDGAKAENGTRLPGIPPAFFRGFKGKIYSGDIHVPQVVSKVPWIEYVGAPYRVHFGDSYTPRVLLLKHGQASDLHYPSVNKHLFTVKKPSTLERYVSEVNEGDQVKVRVQLKRSEYPTWKTVKEQIVAFATQNGWVLFGPELVPLPADRDAEGQAALDESKGQTPAAVLKAYCQREKVNKELAQVGTELLKAV